MDLGELYRREYGRILASLIAKVRDITLAEDAVQEAFVAAHVQWLLSGIPQNPGAWLLTASRHKAIDQIRRRTLSESRREAMIAHLAPEAAAPDPHDLLRLIFTCCHPALAPEAQVALTLRAVCGLTTEEIARAFVLPVATLAQRLVRAKAKIKHAGIPYRVPQDEELAARMPPVLAVIYLIFNEGYAASSGDDLVRRELCTEAIHLARDLTALLPTHSESKGLLALMLLQDSRRAARVGPDGCLLLLEAQNRSDWDRATIAEGITLLDEALHTGAAGTYTIQAAIAALHGEAPSYSQTDWPQIAALYKHLAQLQPSPIVELNRAVAIAMGGDLEEGLRLIEHVSLPGYHLLPAARADLLRRLHRPEEAAAAYREALTLVGNQAERRFLESRLAALAK